MGLSEAALLAFTLNANTVPNYLSCLFPHTFNPALYLMEGGF